MQPETPMLKTHQDYAAALKKANLTGYRDGFSDGYETAVQDVKAAFEKAVRAKRAAPGSPDGKEVPFHGTRL